MNPVRDRTAWLEGGNALCLHPPPVVGKTWRLILLGPPGVGKGTQAELLCHALGACPLSTGDVFRAAQGHAAPPGSAMAEAHACMERGELVSDDIVLALIRERRRCLHCTGGFMLDGFPRTLAQAGAIDALFQAEHLQLDAVIDYELPASEVIARISGRRLCPRCKRTYHLTHHPPRRAGLCDRCGEALIQRADDRAEAVQVRFDAFNAATAPLAAHYREKGLLVPIDASGPPTAVLARTLDALANRVLQPSPADASPTVLSVAYRPPGSAMPAEAHSRA